MGLKSRDYLQLIVSKLPLLLGFGFLQWHPIIFNWILTVSKLTQKMRDYCYIPHEGKEKIFIQYMHVWQAVNWIWCLSPLCRSKCRRWNTPAEQKRLSQPQLLWHEGSIYSSISGFDGQHPALCGPPSALLPATTPLRCRGRSIHWHLFPESGWCRKLPQLWIWEMMIKMIAQFSHSPTTNIWDAMES